ncbi:GNAT family N-acetyltransferase [Trueperella sp. LYQ143]|uniref:GNAT family N-acetyltransferase n=1 Tax=unclassified Trueperella TaxID=2630174 RepID=UPI0039832BF4
MFLRSPLPTDEAEIRAIDEQFATEDFCFSLINDGESWAEYLQRLTQESRGENLPADRVRADFFLAQVDDQIVGRLSIRYALTDYLLKYGGHVGYAVRPEYRRRGYATHLLAEAVSRLHTCGIERVLVTCDDDNIPSAKTIERCGGVLENIVRTPQGHLMRRYWINSSTPAHS